MITLFMMAKICRGGGMADAQVSGTCGGNTMWVQLPSSAPIKQKSFIIKITLNARVVFYFFTFRVARRR